MDKKAIKEFAVWARKKLLSEVQAKAYRIGINEKEILRPLSISTATVQFFDIGTDQPSQISGKEIKQRNNLVEKIQGKAKSSDYQTAYASIMEQVAYTWFNRLIAIRFMEVNDYLPSQLRVLSSVTQGKREPDLVTTPFEAGFAYTDQEMDLIQAYQEKNQLDALFRLLFIKQCNELNQILPELFEQTEDYTEMLLTINYTDTDGVVSHLVNDISEDDFKEAVEIIGWMYQYYNIEPKDEAFALLKKNVKITKERIPAATQLFTPEWIVHYMVENSLGRYWVDGHSDTHLKQAWSYYIEEAPQEERVEEQLKQLHKQHREQSLEAIKLIDPCMGSGHILVYAFDVLMQLYESQGYTARDAVQSIIENNLYGLELDDRAYQLAYFAIMMKARQHDRRAFSRNLKPQVYAIKESNSINLEAIEYFNTTNEQPAIFQQLNSLHKLFIDAKEYGATLNVPNYDWEQIETYLDTLQYSTQVSLDELYAKQTIKELHQLIKVAKLLAKQYEIVVTNPPYMGNSGMNANLSKYVKEHYPDSKSDLFAVFIERCAELTKDKGYQAMITQHSWMFLSSFENLRKKLQTRTIINMAHLGARAFEEIGGEVVQTASFIYCKEHIDNYQGTYCRLIEPTTQQGKEDMFLANENRYVSKQDNFSKIPGEPIAYWASEKIISSFVLGRSFKEIGNPKVGMKTSNNDKFLRMWNEVNYLELSNNISKKWIKYLKGGPYRRWYGNLDYVLWYNGDPNFITSQQNTRVLPENELTLLKCTWTDIGTKRFSCRIAPKDTFHDMSGHCFYPSIKYQYYLLALSNSKVFQLFVDLINSSLHYQVGDIARVPVFVKYENIIDEKCKENCLLSKQDWDSYETSWDFKKHPLI